MITNVCDVWYIQISNYWIIKCKLCMWVLIVMWLAHVLLSCHDTFAIFTHGAHTNCFSRCAYATNSLICSNFSNAYFPREFYWCLNINCTYLKYMLLAHIDGRFVWNIHMLGIITYVGCAFTPHLNSEYFKYLNVRCTKPLLYVGRLPHCICVGIPMGCDFFMIYDSFINCVFPWKCNFFG